MKFAHFADIHIGSWRDPHLKNISTECFCAAVEKSISLDVDFVVLPGDLFNTSLPSIDQLKIVTSQLHVLRDKGIPCYIIPGSHDFSASGKTMIDVLEAAGLVVNVMRGDVMDGSIRLRFTVDEKTGAKLTGVVGRKGMLDKQYYENLVLEHLEAESGFKIFLWHTAIDEFKPKGLEKMEAVPLSFFPKGFDYYAGGHVHVRMDETPASHGRITLPGSLFPVNFDELEKYGHGGMYVYDSSLADPLRWLPVKLYESHSFSFDCEGKTAEEIFSLFEQEIHGKEFGNSLVTLRFSGVLEGVRMADINFRKMFEILYAAGAKAVVKNTLHLTTKEFEEIKVSHSSVEELESALISEHAGSFDLGMDAASSASFVQQLMHALDTDKQEGEKGADFDARVLEETEAVVKRSFE